MSEPVPSMSPSPSPPNDPDYIRWLARKAEWWRWHNDNPLVWAYFQRFAFDAIKAGRVRLSHWLIMNRIRWYVNIETTGVIRGDEEFKISNDHFAWYARFWKAKFPEHAGLFKTHRMIGEPPDSPLVG